MLNCRPSFSSTVSVYFTKGSHCVVVLYCIVLLSTIIHDLDQHAIQCTKFHVIISETIQYHALPYLSNEFRGSKSRRVSDFIALHAMTQELRSD